MQRSWWKWSKISIPLQYVMGFTTVNMIKTNTLCNESKYGTEEQREQEKV